MVGCREHLSSPRSSPTPNQSRPLTTEFRYAHQCPYTRYCRHVRFHDAPLLPHPGASAGSLKCTVESGKQRPTAPSPLESIREAVAGRRELRGRPRVSGWEPSGRRRGAIPTGSGTVQLGQPPGLGFPRGGAAQGVWSRGLAGVRVGVWRCWCSVTRRALAVSVAVSL